MGLLDNVDKKVLVINLRASSESEISGELIVQTEVKTNIDIFHRKLVLDSYDKFAFSELPEEVQDILTETFNKIQKMI